MKSLATDIEVTAEDIKAGKRHDCSRCPVALALNRFTGRVWVVGGDGASLIHSGIQSIRLHFPDTVARWIVMFDDFGRVAPFKFTVKIPKELPK